MLTTTLCAMLAANPTSSWTDSSVDEGAGWAVGGALAWAPVGATSGVLVSGFATQWRGNNQAVVLGVSAIIGAVVGLATGSLFGTAARHGSAAGKKGVLFPAVAELFVVVLATLGGLLVLGALGT
jgi:hypothetical protein